MLKLREPSAAAVFTNDPVEAAIDRCYQDLWREVAIRAIQDYVFFRKTNRANRLIKNKNSTMLCMAKDWSTAKSFLSRQENIDMLGLDLDSEELLRMLDNVNPEDMKKRIVASAAIPYQNEWREKQKKEEKE